VIDLGRSLSLQFDLEKLVWLDIGLDIEASNVELLVSCNQNEAGPLWNFYLTRVFKRQHVLDIVTGLKDHILLKSHILELSLVDRVCFNNRLLVYE